MTSDKYSSQPRDINNISYRLVTVALDSYLLFYALTYFFLSCLGTYHE